MKKILAYIAVMSALTTQMALSQQRAVSLSAGESVTVELPFDIARYNVGDDDVLSVNLLAQRRASLQGRRAGTTTVTLMGGSGESQVYEVRVQTDVGELLQALRIALEDVPAVEMDRAGDRVVLRGLISRLDNWNQVERVVAAFGDQVLNLTRLEMPPEILVNLREGLRKAGFEIADNEQQVGERNPGVLSVTGVGRTVHVGGTVYSPEHVRKIYDIIAAQQWLTVEHKDRPTPTTRYAASVDVTVVPLILEVDLAFIAISDEDHRRVGVNLFEAGLLSVEAVGAIAGDAFQIGSRRSGSTTTDGTRVLDPTVRRRDIGRGRSDSLTYDVFSRLSGTLQFFAEEVPERVIYRGQLNFRNAAEEWRELHSGGTLMVRLVGERETSLKEIDYGFILKVRGGLKDKQAATLDLEFELSAPDGITVTEVGDYNISRERITTSVDCRLGHTMVLGGVNSLFDDTAFSGTPVLRSIPLLRTFFSQRESTRKDTQMLVLVSPHIVGEAGRVAPLSDANVQMMEISEQPSEERMERRRRRRWFFF